MTTEYLVFGYLKNTKAWRTYGPFMDRAEAERCVTALAGSDDELGDIRIKLQESSESES